MSVPRVEPTAGGRDSLRAQALRCRRLADSIGDRQALDALAAMADAFEARARALETAQS